MEDSLGGGVGGAGAGMEVPLVRESESDGDRGPIWKDSADWPMRGTDFRLICGPAWEDIVVQIMSSRRKVVCRSILWRSYSAMLIVGLFFLHEVHRWDDIRRNRKRKRKKKNNDAVNTDEK